MGTQEATGSKTQLHWEELGHESHRVEAGAFLLGNDIVVVIGGGTKWHIGAVALAVPRSSLADPSQVSASASVLCVTGHKEDDLARSAALFLASTLKRTVTVVVGIHIDQASGEDINIVTANCHAAIERLQEKLR